MNKVDEEKNLGDAAVDRETGQGQRRAAKCPNCGGRGSIRTGRGLLRTTEGCEDCHGTGRVIPRDQLIRELNAEIAFLNSED